MRALLPFLFGAAAALSAAGQGSDSLPNLHGYPETSTRIVHLPAEQRLVLLVPMACYENAATGRQVDLIGAIHIGEEDYYRRLNRLMGQYDKLLFEMVGGDDVQELLRLLKRGDALSSDELKRADELTAKIIADQNANPLGSLISWVQTHTAEQTRLANQSELIDYTRDHFVFADMSMAQYREASRDLLKGSFSDLALLFVVPGMPVADQLLAQYHLLVGSPESARRALLACCSYPTPPDAGDGLIIGARNAVCMQVLDRVMQDEQVKRIGIFYGSAHLRDLDLRLRERGFTLTAVRWLRAFSVPADRAPRTLHPAAAPATPQPENA